MKEELASLDLHYLLKELDLEDAKVNKVYQMDQKSFLLDLHKTGVGKTLLRFTVGTFLYRTSYKPDMPKKPHGYCTYLRKHLSNTRLRRVEQVGFERIVRFVFEGKEKMYHFYVELFGKGNAVLCDDEDVIMSPLQRQEWSERSVKKGEVYTYPKQDISALYLTEGDLESLFDESDLNIVKTLAVKLGLGGTYAEEVCLRAGVDKNADTPTAEDRKKLFDAIQSLLDKEIRACIYREDTKVKDIVPFELVLYEKLEKERKDSYNEALDSIITVREEKKAVNEQQAKKEKKLGKIEKIISAQEKQLKKLEKTITENQRKGELIYEHYQEVDQLLKEIEELRQTMSWKEIKERYKDHPLVTDVLEKEKTVVVDIGE